MCSYFSQFPLDLPLPLTRLSINSFRRLMSSASNPNSSVPLLPSPFPLFSPLQKWRSGRSSELGMLVSERACVLGLVCLVFGVGHVRGTALFFAGRRLIMRGENRGFSPSSTESNSPVDLLKRTGRPRRSGLDRQCTARLIVRCFA